MDIKNTDNVSVNLQSDVASTNSNSSIDQLLEGKKDGDMVTVGEFDIVDHVPAISGEITVQLDDLNSTKAKSLTLDEATEAILFSLSTMWHKKLQILQLTKKRPNLKSCNRLYLFLESLVLKKERCSPENAVPSPRKADKENLKRKENPPLSFLKLMKNQLNVLLGLRINLIA